MKEKTLLYNLGEIIGLARWIWLLTLDWKIGLAVAIAIWGNNIFLETKFK